VNILKKTLQAIEEKVRFYQFWHASSDSVLEIVVLIAFITALLYLWLAVMP
jgi:divalent metal cation (Fe/Co/Zn/Cd) transporter